MTKKAKTKSRTESLFAGFFVLSIGIIVGYAGLVSYSSFMILAGVAIGFMGLCTTIFGLINFVARRHAR